MGYFFYFFKLNKFAMINWLKSKEIERKLVKIRNPQSVFRINMKSPIFYKQKFNRKKNYNYFGGFFLLNFCKKNLQTKIKIVIKSSQIIVGRSQRKTNTLTRLSYRLKSCNGQQHIYGQLLYLLTHLFTYFGINKLCIKFRLASIHSFMCFCSARVSLNWKHQTMNKFPRFDVSTQRSYSLPISSKSKIKKIFSLEHLLSPKRNN